MTKEELKKEAEESAKKFFGKPTDLVDLDNLRIFKNGYFAGAEPREKQIQIDAEQILALQKQNGELTDKVKELKAQIEKMKNCFNCAKGDWNNRVKCIKSGCVNKNKWELAE